MDYGTFLEKALDGILISYKEYGSYSGDFIAIIEKDHDWLIFKGRYGSCSGCDWLHSTRIYSEEDYQKLDDTEWGEESEKLEASFKLEPKIVEEFLEENQPFLVLPKFQVPETLEDFKALLPANTRTVQNEEWEDVDQDAVVFEQMQNFKINNLKYLEKKVEWDEQRKTEDNV